MPRFDNPIVLATRPMDASTRFLMALQAAAGPFKGIASPAFENVAVPHQTPDFDIAVFTSRAGVAFAPIRQNRVAYCVGDATAQAATVAGYKAISAQGSAADLVSLILSEGPTGKLLHVRGETSVGDVTTHLTQAGLTCDEVIAYRKQPTLPTPDVTALIAPPENILIPLFSAETVSILALWPVDFSSSHVVAISPAVADAATLLTPASTHLSEHPDLPNMVAATARLIA